MVGPAGTGKSFVVGAIAKAWQDHALWGKREQRVIGLATSQIATEVLAVLEKHRVDDLVVVNDKGQPVGLVDTQDLTRMKLV